MIDYLNSDQIEKQPYPAGIDLFKLSNGNIRTIYKIFPKSTIATHEQRQWLDSGVFIVNFKQI